MAEDTTISRLAQWKGQSENLRSMHEHRWATNMKLMMGVWDDEELAKSKVRQRSKIYFRKIWSTVWRITASLYNAFLRDPDNFKIDGRGPEDVLPARVLQRMVEYRKDKMMRKDSLFIKFIWAFQDILSLGWCCGKLTWEYNPKTKKDGPRFVLYPPEQVYPDLTADTEEDMRYIIFENFMSKEDMEDLGYENIKDAHAVAIPHNQVRGVRFSNSQDPLQNPSQNEYPRAGKYYDGKGDGKDVGTRYKVYEVFWREGGKIRFCVTDMDKVFFRKPQDSPYGDCYPSVMGSCLLTPHKLMGEGFPEPLEGPQKSYNHTLNMRKDNVTMSLAKMKIVNRFGNVDLQSLTNMRPGGIVLADDADMVRELETRDVTQSAYIEASADDMMMQDMSGVTPTLQGMGTSDKATVAQINQSEGNAKIDLYLAIIGETFVRSFYSKLAYAIQRFETDENVFRVGNEGLRREMGIAGQYVGDVYDLDFDADIVLNVGAGTVGRDLQIRQDMLAMDRAIMANQSQLGMVQAGIMPIEQAKLFNVAAFMEDLLPKIGRRDIERYFIQAKPPVPQGEGGGPAGPRGLLEPQIGDNEVGAVANELQAGGLGGI